jgi:hypothetical protein
MPARLRDIKRALEAHGCSVEPPRKGSHWKATNGAGAVYPLPAHNGLKSVISDVYIRAMCRAFELDYENFRDSL